ncbi:MAG: AAA family ATPase [Lautropia sp.]|nr:AAA family ATPase [Lautropia sp.]
MLSAIVLKNFKSYRDATLPLAPLTVLIGANASGKSNLIEAMRLLSWLAQGQRLFNIQSAVQDGDRVVRGTVRDLPFQGGRDFGLGARTTAETWNRFDMTITRRQDSEDSSHVSLHVESERIWDAGHSVDLYVLDKPSVGHGTDVAVSYNNFARGGKKPHVTCTDQAAVFTQLDSPAAFAASHKQSRERIPAITRELARWLSNMLFLDAAPAQMREYAFPSDTQLHGSGRNLSAVLFNLWEGGSKKTGEGVEMNRADILSFIQSLPEQDIASLSFLHEPRGGVMVALEETFGGVKRQCDASLLSDGTLRVLAIAAAMLSAPEGSLVVIEEVDNGVHPSRASHLLAQIQRIARRRQLRVLLSTHNPALLDALPDEAVPDVVFCYRDIEDGSSRLVRLADAPDYPELIAQGSLGHLMTSGVLERFIKHHPGAEARQRQALQWLEQLRAGAING